jgi:hypothetical protein
MSRLDVNRLTVPAEFAAIFDRHDAPVAASAAETAVEDSPAPLPQPHSSLLDALGGRGTGVNHGKCPKCSSTTSAVETKMGRCLTCGTSFAGGTVHIGI